MFKPTVHILQNNDLFGLLIHHTGIELHRADPNFIVFFDIF